MDDGIRIQKILSEKGILSRRKAEEAITQGRIIVNGRPATIGQKINPRKDIVILDGKAVNITGLSKSVYIMLNKPRGYITTTNDSHDRKTVMDLVKDVGARVYPVGRLDRNTEGLLLFTNDGVFANEVMHPKGEVPKTYRVSIRGGVKEEQLIALSTGIVLDDGYRTLPSAVHVLEQEQNRTVLQITITEGKNRLIRRMCESAGLELIRLKRTSVGPIKLGMLKPGTYRELTKAEMQAMRGAMDKAK